MISFSGSRVSIPQGTGPHLMESARDACFEGARTLDRAIKVRLSSHTKTGALNNSWRIRPLPDGALLYSISPVSKWLDRGTKPHTIYPRNFDSSRATAQPIRAGSKEGSPFRVFRIAQGRNQGPYRGIRAGGGFGTGISGFSRSTEHRTRAALRFSMSDEGGPNVITVLYVNHPGIKPLNYVEAAELETRAEIELFIQEASTFAVADQLGITVPQPTTGRRALRGKGGLFTGSLPRLG